MSTIQGVWRILLVLTVASLLAAGCGQSKRSPSKPSSPDDIKSIAHDAYIYAYPLMEQVKTLNGMFEFMDMKANRPSMNDKSPSENVGMPIVAPNLTSMTGGIFIDISGGPVTIEIPEVKDRYIGYQCIDVFTHNFHYLGTRANGGEAGRFVFHNKSQSAPDGNGAVPILLEGDHAIILVRIDIKDDSELERVRAIQSSIKVVSAPETTRDYPTYDEKKATSPDFVEYLNTLISDVPQSETALFERFAKIGVKSNVTLNDEQRHAVQAGIDEAMEAIDAQSEALEVGHGWFGATTVFGTREFLDGNYLGRAAGAHFGLWGNSKEEANYFMLQADGEGEIRFTKAEMPPLTEMGFWSVTVHDENVHVKKNEHDSYVLTTDKMNFEDDGGLVLKISSKPEEGNWLYTPGGKLVILIRAYQADPDRIEDYVPPPFVRRSK